MKKLAVVIGHNPVQKGAHTICPLCCSEFEFNTKVAKIMKAIAEANSIDVEIFFRQYYGVYKNELGRRTSNLRKEIKKVYSKVNEWNPDLSIELHFNAYRPNVSGTETLSSGSPNSMLYAQLMQSQMVKLFDRNTKNKGDRGVKIRNSENRGRGYLSLVSSRCPAILVEPFFGSNTEDCMLMFKIGLERLANTYIDASYEALDKIHTTEIVSVS